MRLYQSVEKAAIQYADSCAVVYGDIQISYRELIEKVNNLSNAILRDAQNETIIGISATRSIEMIVGVLAILKAGKAYLPLDATYPKLRLEQLIVNSEIKYCLSNANESDFYECFNLTVVKSDKYYELPELVIPFENPIVCVLYTSGSTGVPKGVCLGEDGLLNLINCQIANGFAKPFVKTLQYCHLSFDAAFQEIFVPLITGGCLHIVNDHYRLNAGNLLKYINDYQINRIFLPYVMVQLLAETAETYTLYPRSLQEVITGGELLVITPQIAKFFNVMLDTTLMNVYGPTETSIWVTELKLRGKALEWPTIPSIGKPIDGVAVFVLDEQLKEVSVGTIGEIYIYGNCLALGYLNQPQQTAERFIYLDHPNLGKIRVYKTGDQAAYQSNGKLLFHGRIDGQVKIRGGNRVELGEVEVVLGKIDGVSQVQVIVREDKTGQKKIVAYIVAKNHQLTETAIKKEIGNQLPDYMVPSAVVFMDSFPYTVSGKVDLNQLPAPEININIENYIPPTNEAEQYLTNMWQDLLQVDILSVLDNFFELGGNSLLAIQMMVRLEKERGIELPLVSVFEFSTIKKLAKLITGESNPKKFDALVAIKPTGSRPPIYLIHGDSLNVLSFVGLSRHINQDQPIYGLQPIGVHGDTAPLETIEAIAKFYNDAIQKQNPIGPYAIAGYSFGGYVAVEMAKQLKAQGKVVLLLGMFDTNVINAENFLSWRKQLRRKLLRQIPKLKWFISSLFKDPIAAIDYQLTALANRLRSIFNITTKRENPEITSYYEMMDRVNGIHHNALFNYNLEPMDEKVVLFKAQERVYFVDDFEFLGWRKYARKGVEVHSIPGNHASMFTEPNCKILANEMDLALSLANEQFNKNNQ